jgi:hypothetical protein
MALNTVDVSEPEFVNNSFTAEAVHSVHIVLVPGLVAQTVPSWKNGNDTETLLLRKLFHTTIRFDFSKVSRLT